MVDVTRSASINPVKPADPKAQGKKQRDQEAPEDEEQAVPAETRDIDDLTVIMGVPVGDLTAEVREALGRFMEEHVRQRDELQHTRDHAAFLEEQADRHSLLPVLNRRAFLRELGRVMVHAEQSQITNGFVCCRLANYGDIFRRNGRAAADMALTHMAETLAQGLRASDVLGSLGGQDFGVILTVTDAATARQIAGQLGDALAKQKLAWDGNAFGLDAALGVHVFSTGASADAIIDAADKDLLAREIQRQEDAGG